MISINIYLPHSIVKFDIKFFELFLNITMFLSNVEFAYTLKAFKVDKQ